MIMVDEAPAQFDGSGVCLTDEYRTALEPLKSELKNFWIKRGQFIADSHDLWLEMADEFGSRLEDDFCRKLQFREFGCLHVALAYAKELAAESPLN